MDHGCCGSRQRAVPQPDEFERTPVVVARRGEYFFGLHIQEAQAHGPVAHNAFQVAHAAAAAEALLGIERYHHVACFPDTLVVWTAAETYPVAEIPDPD